MIDDAEAGPVAGGGGGLELVAYQTAARDLDRQEAALNELLARAGTVLTASSIVASFLGSQAIKQVGFGVITWTALVAFLASVVLCVWILVPRPTLTFALDGPAVYQALYEHGENTPEVHRRLAYWIAGFYTKNQIKIDRLALTYQVAAAAVVARVSCGHSTSASADDRTESQALIPTPAAATSTAGGRTARDENREPA